MYRHYDGHHIHRAGERPWRRRCRIFLLLFGLLTQLATGAIVQSQEGESNHIGVIYPAVRKPYRSIFLNIIQGIEAGLSDPVPVFELPEDGGDDAVSQWLHENSFDATIVLGKRGLELFPALDKGQRLVFGAVYTNPADVSNKVRTISMAPDPARLFDHLIALAPSTKRITVIHDQQDNDWLIKLAGVAAEMRRLELNVIHSASIRDAADAYRRILREASSREDAVWLLQASRFLQERSLLDMILTEAWKRNVVVFSSNPSHVPRGALFALYPDNHELGEELALAAANPSGVLGVTPVENLNTAVNVRTAEHLGINIDRALGGDIDMAFPNH